MLNGLFSPYTKGFNAAIHGATPYSNPYFGNTDSLRAWDQGYRDGLQEVLQQALVMEELDSFERLT